MRILAAGNNSSGFTLLELLVVVAIMAIATAGVGLALRDTADVQLEREAQRLAALLESARAQSRMSAYPVRWRTTPGGFIFDGLPGPETPYQWLDSSVQAADAQPVLLGPEPIITPQSIRLVSSAQPARSLRIATDGVQPFAVTSGTSGTPGTP